MHDYGIRSGVVRSVECLKYWSVVVNIYKRQISRQRQCRSEWLGNAEVTMEGSESVDEC